MSNHWHYQLMYHKYEKPNAVDGEGYYAIHEYYEMDDGPGWSATVRPEKERMQRAQSRKRRQIRRSEQPLSEMQIWAYVVFALCMVGLVIYRLSE